MAIDLQPLRNRDASGTATDGEISELDRKSPAARTPSSEDAFLNAALPPCGIRLGAGGTAPVGLELQRPLPVAANALRGSGTYPLTDEESRAYKVARGVVARHRHTWPRVDWFRPQYDVDGLAAWISSGDQFGLVDGGGTVSRNRIIAALFPISPSDRPALIERAEIRPAVAAALVSRLSVDKLAELDATAAAGLAFALDADGSVNARKALQRLIETSPAVSVSLRCQLAHGRREGRGDQGL